MSRKKIAIKPSLIHSGSGLAISSVPSRIDDRKLDGGIIEAGQRRISGEDRQDGRAHEQNPACRLQLQKLLDQQKSRLHYRFLDYFIGGSYHKSVFRIFRKM